MPDISGVINMLTQMFPQAANNPQAQEMLNVIRSGDAQRGQEIANNICQSYGMDRDTMIQNASSFFSQFKVGK